MLRKLRRSCGGFAMPRRARRSRKKCIIGQFRVGAASGASILILAVIGLPAAKLFWLTGALV